MAYQKIRINGTITYDCTNVCMAGERFDVSIISTKFDSVCASLEKIDKIELLSEAGEVYQTEKNFDSYSSIVLENGFYKDLETNVPLKTLRITFKRTASLEERVNKLDEKINPTFDISSMTIDEYRDYKKKQIGDTCRNKIYEGCDVETAFGTEHFTFNSDDQMNLNTTYLAALNTGLPQSYHPSTNPSSPCVVYSAKDIISMYITLQANLLYHQTYCNMLNTLLGTYTSKTEMMAVTYGMDLPSDLQEKLDTVLKNGKEVTDAILIKAGLKEPATDEPITDEPMEKPAEDPVKTEP